MYRILYGTPAGQVCSGLSGAAEWQFESRRFWLRVKPAMGPAGALAPGTRAAAGLPAREIRFRDVSFAYPSIDEALADLLGPRSA